MIVQCDAKICSRCKEKQSYSNFSINKHRADGFNNECKPCYNSRYLERTQGSKRYNKFNGSKQEYNTSYYKKHYQNNKGYYRNKCAIRERNLQQATPNWGIAFFIQEAYHLAQKRSKLFNFSWEVDHIIPINSEFVCGLHVEHNLQVVPTKWNRAKSNQWDCEKGVKTYDRSSRC